MKLTTRFQEQKIFYLLCDVVHSTKILFLDAKEPEVNYNECLPGC